MSIRLHLEGFAEVEESTGGPKFRFDLFVDGPRFE
jgi:hypothetical protein